MAELDIGLNAAGQQLAGVLTAVHKLGEGLDTTEFKAKKLTQEVAKATAALTRVQERMEERLRGVGKSSTEAEKAMAHAKVVADNVFISIAAANLKATVQSKAYTGQLAELQKVLNDTAEKNNYVKWLQKSHLYTTNLMNENNFLSAALQKQDSEIGRINSARKAELNGLRNVQAAGAKLEATNKMQIRTSELLTTAVGKETEILKVQNQGSIQRITLDTRVGEAIKYKKAQLDHLSTAQGRENALADVQLQSATRLVTAEARLGAELVERARRTELLGTENGKLNSVMKVQERSLEAATNFTARMTAASAEQARVTVYAGTEEGKRNAVLRAQSRALEESATFETRKSAASAELARETAYQATEAGKLNAILRVQGRTEQDLTTFEARMAQARDELARKTAYAGTEEGKRNAILVAQGRALQEAATFETRKTASGAEQARETAYQATEAGKLNAILRVQGRTLNEAATFDVRKTATSAELARETAYQATEAGKLNAVLRVQGRALNEAATFDARKTATSAELAREMAYQSTEAGKLNAILRVQGRTEQDLATFEARMAQARDELARKTAYAGTEEGRRNAILVAQGRALQEATTFETRKTAAGAEQARTIEFLTTAEGRHLANMRVEGRTTEQLVTSGARLNSEIRLRQSSLAALDTLQGKQNENLKVEERAKVHLETADARLIATHQATITQLAQILSETGRVVAILKEQIKTETALATANEKMEGSTKLVRVQIEQLGTARGHENVLSKQTLANMKFEMTEQSRLEARLAAVLRERESLMGGIRQQILLEDQANRMREAEILSMGVEKAKIEALHREIESLNNGYGREIVRLTELRNERRNQLAGRTKESKAVSEQEAALIRERAALERVQNQLALTSSARGLAITKIKMEIREQEALNRIRAMSTAQLWGLGGGQGKLNVAQEVGSQSTAMLRASMQGLHTSVGMYTSSTILAATATYAISAALRDSAITGAKFEETMARTEAIMSTNGPAMVDRTVQTKALNDQVRALGQTTVFTASEVATGLQQLGMAGFSANDAMTALPATLTLANIANVDMSRSADIASNVLMTFGKDAKDLGSVVDLMATAVNNSNTDIEQLANALSYAGPAAQTAGISIEETTAAIETLANSGIKASRSGSALRRLFVSILNPTKKGQEVIDKYGLSMVDAEGKTRSLVDIVNQLKKAMDGLSGPEQLAAIQNLVGVYATSPVAALIANAGKMATFAAQNTQTKGAGAKMEKIISDNLVFDWKEMLSALEEVQLHAFDSMGSKLRELTATATLEILKLMEPVKTLYTPSGEPVIITDLDRMMTKAVNAAQALGYLAAGFTAMKLANVGVFSAISKDSVKLTKRMTELTTRYKINGAGLLMMGSNADGTRTRMDLLNLTLGRTYQVAGMATWGIKGLSMVVNGLAISLGFLSKAAGVGFLLWGVYEAINAVFGKDTDQEIVDHAVGVDKVESSYARLKRTIEDMGLAKQRAALKTLVTSNEDGVKQVNTDLANNQLLIDRGRAAGVNEEFLAPLVKAQASLQLIKKDFEAQVVDANKALGDLNTTTIDYDADLKEHAKTLQDVTNLTNQLTLARALADKSAKGGPSFAGLARADAVKVTTLQSQLDDLQAKTRGSLIKVQNTDARQTTAEQAIALATKEQEEKANRKHYEKITPLAQQLVDKQKEITAELQNQSTIVAKDRAALALSDKAMVRQARPGADVIKSSTERMAKLEEEREELQLKVDEQQGKLTKTMADANYAEMSDVDKLVDAKRRLVEVNERIAVAEAPPAGKVKDLDKLNDLYREQMQYKQNINSLSKKENREDNRGSREAEQQAKQDLATYTALAKKFDEVSAAQLEMKKGVEAMARLRKGQVIDGELVTISAAQEAKAVTELQVQYHRATLTLDKQYVALEKLRGAYGVSPYTAVIQDLAQMNRLLLDGKMTLDEYSQMYTDLKEKASTRLDSLPKVQIGGLPDSASTPFGEFITTAMTAADDLKAFDEAQQKMNRDKNNAMSNFDKVKDKGLAEADKITDHDEKLKRIRDIEQADYDARLAMEGMYGEESWGLQQKLNKYREQSAEMMKISMVGAMGDIFGQFAAVGEEATNAQKLAFIAQKALAVAQIILYTEVAAAGIAASTPGYFGLTLREMVRAQGYAAAGLVASLAVGSLATGADNSSGSTQMFDTGGTIPYNRVGIVGEYGPELVSGPAHVTGRGATKSKLGGGNVYEITLAPVIQVTTEGGTEGNGADQERSAKMVAEAVRGTVMATLQDQMRPGGVIDTFVKRA